MRANDLPFAALAYRAVFKAVDLVSTTGAHVLPHLMPVDTRTERKLTRVLFTEAFQFPARAFHAVLFAKFLHVTAGAHSVV